MTGIEAMLIIGIVVFVSIAIAAFGFAAQRR